MTNIKKNVIINPQHERYRCLYKKYIIGKIKINQKNYDQLVFCSRDIKGEKMVPNFIEYIMK